MKVTKLTSIFGQRVIVQFDLQPSLTIPLDTAVQFSLKPNLDISQDKYEEIKNSAHLQSMWNRVLKWVTIRPRSIAEFKRYTQDKLTPELTETFSKRLIDLKFLSDKDFSSWWVESRQNSRPKSKLELTQELKRKGISYDDLNLALSQSDQEAACLVVAQKYAKKLSKFSIQVKKQKLYGYLNRRGFDYEIIKNVTNIILK